MELTSFQKDKLESSILKFLKSLPKYENSKHEKPTPASFLMQLANDLKGKCEFKYDLVEKHDNFEELIENEFSLHTFKSHFIIPFGQDGQEVRLVGMCSSRDKRISKEFSSLDIIFQMNRLRSTKNHLIKVLM